MRAKRQRSCARSWTISKQVETPKHWVFSKFDKYDGPTLLTDADIEAAIALVPEKLKADIQFAHENVRRLAEAQKATVEIFKIGVVPGGRYNQIASAIMTVTTAKVSVCNHIIACSPPRM